MLFLPENKFHVINNGIFWRKNVLNDLWEGLILVRFFVCVCMVHIRIYEGCFLSKARLKIKIKRKTIFKTIFVFRFYTHFTIFHYSLQVCLNTYLTLQQDLEYTLHRNFPPGAIIKRSRLFSRFRLCCMSCRINNA